MRIRAVLATMLCLACGCGTTDDEWKGDPDLGTNIVGAVVADGRLWLSGERHGDRALGGALVSYDLADGTRTRHMANTVAGIVKQSGHLLALVAADSRHFSLEEWKDGAFVLRSRVELAAIPTLFTLIGGQPATVSAAGITRFDGQDWRTTAIDLTPPGRMHRPPVAAGATASGSDIYVGYNFGEWGGGLTRIDMTTGEATPMDFEGNWFSNVNAVIADPADKDCILAASGLIHLGSRGAIGRVCGDISTPVFSQPDGGPDKHDSEAFYQLIPAADGYWAVSNRAVYHFTASATPLRYPLSGFQLWHGLYVSHDAPGAILVLSEISRQMAVNGGMPLIAPLD